jgi:hypothetical protein
MLGRGLLLCLGDERRGRVVGVLRPQDADALLLGETFDVPLGLFLVRERAFFGEIVHRALLLERVMCG